MKYIIDVRTPAEYASGHKVDALNHDVRRLATGELPNMPEDSEIEVYCASGGRSALAKKLLENAGFINVTDTGGYAG